MKSQYNFKNAKRGKFFRPDAEMRLPEDVARDARLDRIRAKSVHYDRKSRRIVIELNSKLVVSFHPADVEGLAGATPAQLEKIDISPSGLGIYFPALDADLYIPGLLEGFLGSKKWGRPKP